MKVKVTKIKIDWDMRLTHPLKDCREATSLKRGECLMAFNARQTMIRLIDCVGGVHTWYKKAGDGVFDIKRIAVLMNDGLLVELQVGRAPAERARKLFLVRGGKSRKRKAA